MSNLNWLSLLFDSNYIRRSASGLLVKKTLAQGLIDMFEKFQFFNFLILTFIAKKISIRFNIISANN